jgi:hypothetical protein
MHTRKPRRKRGPILAVGLLFAAGAVVRLAVAERQSLWADELFSLAMATGHSLEHPAPQADAGRGDFVESLEAIAPRAYSRYLEPDQPPASAARVVRAVALSDTNPPLYYLLLSLWIRSFGAGDGALRLFSVLCALAAAPLVASLARQLGGRDALVPAAILFALSPLCLYYSTEGRMYSLLWLFAAGTLWLTLRLRATGAGTGGSLCWIVMGTGGLLTHYFFASLWLTTAGWLLIHPGRWRRRWIFISIAATGLVVLPWYLGLPESLSRWRVTGGWLTLQPAGYDSLATPASLVAGLFSGHMPWLLSRRVQWLHAGLFLALLPVAASLGWRLYRGRRGLLWLAFFAAAATPCLADLALGTYSSANPRYATAGLPAALALAAFLVARLPVRVRVAFLLVFVAVGLAGARSLFRRDAREGEPYDTIGRFLARNAGPSDVVIVHSIPSGVAGVARALVRNGGDSVPLAAWVGALRQRQVPRDIEALAAGRGHIFLVVIHAVGEPAPQEAWLREHAVLGETKTFESGSVAVFEGRRGSAITLAPAEWNLAR